MSLMVREEFERLVSEVRENFPTEIDSYLDPGKGVCCRLHGPSLLYGPCDSGCYVENLGVHPALRAFHEHGNVVCHLSDPQRHLDKRFARSILQFEDDFVSWCYSRPQTYRSKFMRGNYARQSVYGAGYCYLRGVEEGAKSRAARILGPMPLVADYLRVFLAFGMVGGKRLALKSIGSGKFHMTNARHRKDFITVARELAAIAREDPWARIGGDVSRTYLCFRNGSDVSDPFSVSEEEGGAVENIFGFERHGFSFAHFPVIGFSRVAVEALGVYSEERFLALYSWFASKGIFLNEMALNQMLLATTAFYAVGGASGSLARQTVRNWAVVGDLTMKLASATSIICKAGSPAEYNNCLTLQRNEDLAVNLISSGIRAHCHVELLDSKSKSNATIFEAIVGVLALFGAGKDFETFLCATGLLEKVMPLSVDKRFASSMGDVNGIAAENSVKVSLNSGQYARVVKMIEEGKL